jgi:hypothetical protein
LPDLDFDKWIDSINDLAIAAGMTQEELLSMFEAMGMSVDPESIVLSKVTLTEKVPKYESSWGFNEEGKYVMTTQQVGTTDMTTQK